MKYIIILLTSLFLVSNASAGDIDGKGLVCGPVGYYFHDDLHSLHHVRNGKLVIEDMGEYRTNPDRIYVKNSLGKIFSIIRNNPYVRVPIGPNTTSTYDCKIAIGYPSFYEMLNSNLENITKNNKI